MKHACQGSMGIRLMFEYVKPESDSANGLSVHGSKLSSYGLPERSSFETTRMLTNLVEYGTAIPTPDRPMSKQPAKKPKPKAIELSAQQLVALLIDEAGETRSSIASRTGIHLSAVSRFFLGQRIANENDFRKLAEMAISLKIVD